MNEGLGQRPSGRTQPHADASTQGAAQAQGASVNEESNENIRRSPTQMTDEEKYGLPGLVEATRNQNNDHLNLTIGHDLTALGLDMNSSELV